jgi:hypothetical protein
VPGLSATITLPASWHVVKRPTLAAGALQRLVEENPSLTTLAAALAPGAAKLLASGGSGTLVIASQPFPIRETAAQLARLLELGVRPFFPGASAVVERTRAGLLAHLSFRASLLAGGVRRRARVEVYALVRGTTLVAIECVNATGDACDAAARSFRFG